MASIFTFDPDPPRVSSPWQISTQQLSDPLKEQRSEEVGSAQSQSTVGSASLSSLVGSVGVTRLEAEPQEGPTEYKLHLLLRPRRSFLRTSTTKQLSRNMHSKQLGLTAQSNLDTGSNIPTPTVQFSGSRQHRLEQLTTQLLWRLQQSSPYHLSSSNNLILPTLPQATPTLDVPQKPARLLPGLEESQGALYEIGVSDDGTFVGLLEDEMTESLNNLRAMAASLGCSVDVLRMVPVGDCEWENHRCVGKDGKPLVVKDLLYVSEAYVKPESGDLHAAQSNISATNACKPIKNSAPATSTTSLGTASSTEQLRVSLTGATTSGKSSLLGTLSTSTLDNGRGKSRLSLLKHRHEIASGMTSSVAQELIGYSNIEDLSKKEAVKVINYATGNVSSWDDIHAASISGRLAFLSDSAGHPRYRRTTVRGLVGCAPHWTMLCISANDSVDMGVKRPEGNTEHHVFEGASAHLSMAHLDLCLKLNLPLVVVFTKLDIANRTSFRNILSSLLSTLKGAGRIPKMLSNSNVSVTGHDLQNVVGSDNSEVAEVVETLKKSTAHVPIIFTSSVKGTGIGKLHGLLRHLPVPSPDMRTTPSHNGTYLDDTPTTLFHVDDVYNITIHKFVDAADATVPEKHSSVISGRVAFGKLCVGDCLLLGPFSYSTPDATESAETRAVSLSEGSFLTPRSFTEALAKATASPKMKTTPFEKEWQYVRIVSIRNLRLPVRMLEQDQVGTIGLVPVETMPIAGPLPIRKGMILSSDEPSAAHTFTASFDVDDASSVVVGSLVVIYCASVRSQAKIIAVALENNATGQSKSGNFEREDDDSDDGFDFQLEETSESKATKDENMSILVTFQFCTTREWLQIGARVLVMPGGGAGFPGGGERALKGFEGLEGLVGKLVEKFG